MEVSCRVLRHLAADRWLVEFSGREMVMQFAERMAEGERLQVRVVEVRPDVVLAKVVESGDRFVELLAGMRIPVSDHAEAREVLAMLRAMGWPLTEGHLRGLMALRRAVGDDAAAMALFVRGVSVERLRGWVPVYGGDVAAAWARLEKTLRESGGGADINGGELSEPEGPFGPLVSAWARVVPVVVFRMRRSAGPGRSRRGPEAEDAELLLGRAVLDRLRSFVTPEAVVVRGTVLWRGGSGWREAEVRLAREPGVWRLSFRTAFERLGVVEVDVVLREVEAGRSLEVVIGHGRGGLGWAERLRRSLERERPGWRVRLRSTEVGEEAAAEVWKGLDVVI